MLVTPKVKIAIVDDEPLLAELFAELLHLAGFDPIVCPPGPAAYSHIREHRPALVLLDVQMAGMNGAAIYHVLHHDPVTHDIPIIFVTGDRHTLSRLLPGAQERNITAIEKPVDAHELVGMIQRVLTHHSGPTASSS